MIYCCSRILLCMLCNKKIEIFITYSAENLCRTNTIMDQLNEFTIQIKQNSMAFRLIIRLLHIMSDDVYIKINTNKMDMLIINPPESCVVFVSCSTDSFDPFDFDSNEIKLNADLDQLYNAVKFPHKSINIHGSDDTLLVNDHKISTVHSVWEAEINSDEFEHIIKLPLQTFIDTCNYIYESDEFVAVELDAKGVHFASVNDDKKRKIIFDGKFSAGDSLIRYGIFELKYVIASFDIKSVCDEVDLYLKCDYPLVIRYNINKSADVYVALSQCVDDS